MELIRRNDPRAARPLPSEVFPTLLPPGDLGRSYPQMPSSLRPSLLQRFLSILGFGRAKETEVSRKPHQFTREYWEERGSGSW